MHKKMKAIKISANALDKGLFTGLHKILKPK